MTAFVDLRTSCSARGAARTSPPGQVTDLLRPKSVPPHATKSQITDLRHLPNAAGWSTQVIRFFP